MGNACCAQGSDSEVDEHVSDWSAKLFLRVVKGVLQEVHKLQMCEVFTGEAAGWHLGRLVLQLFKIQVPHQGS